MPPFLASDLIRDCKQSLRPLQGHRIFGGRGVHCTSAKICLIIRRTTNGRPYEAHRIFSGRGVHCTSVKICLIIRRTTDGRRQAATRLQAISSPLQWILMFPAGEAFRLPSLFTVIVRFCGTSRTSSPTKNQKHHAVFVC